MIKKYFIKLCVRVSGYTQEELAVRAFTYQFIFRNRIKSTYYAVFGHK